LTVEDLREAFIEAFENRPIQPSLERSVVAPRVRVGDKVRSIIDAIRSVGQLSFSKLVRNATSRLEIIVSLLALLELIKQDTVTAVQDGLFGEVSITPGENWDLDQEVEFESEFEE
jgi:segregation and condensation protein A